MKNVFVMVAAAALAASAFAQRTKTHMCPTYIRAVHSYKPYGASVPPVDYYVNGEKIQTMNFRDVTTYLAVPPGRNTIAIRSANQPTSTPLATAEFTAGIGKFYTAGFLGDVPGPAGQRVYSQGPIIVNEDVRTVPNPSRFNGLWYRWSETNAVIDFRTVAGDPANPATAADSERISTLQPKTVIPIAELPTGTPYSFYPVLPGSSTPLPNTRLTATGGFVAVRNLTPRDGSVYDFFATGDSLLTAVHPANNLQVGYTETPLTFDPASGCTLVGAGAGGVTKFAYAYDEMELLAAAASTSTANVDRVERVSIAALALICVCTVILLANLVFFFLPATSPKKAVLSGAATV